MIRLFVAAGDLPRRGVKETMRLAYGEKCLIVLTYNLCLVRFDGASLYLVQQARLEDPLLC